MMDNSSYCFVVLWPPFYRWLMNQTQASWEIMLSKQAPLKKVRSDQSICTSCCICLNPSSVLAWLHHIPMLCNRNILLIWAMIAIRMVTVPKFDRRRWRPNYCNICVKVIQIKHKRRLEFSIICLLWVLKLT
jgi:hypothetical protein